MENSFRDEKSIFNLQVDEVAKSYLLETTKWTKFLTVVSLVMMGLVLLAFIFAGAAMSTVSSSYGGAAGMGALGATGMIILFIFVFALYFYPIYAMLKFSNLTKAGILSADQQRFNEGLGYLKGAFKYMGILMIIVLAFYALIFIFGLLGAMM
jgi:hypothetical protein